MYSVWSINTANNRLLWFMGEFTNVSTAMSRAERVISESNPDVSSVRFEQTCVKDNRTGELTDGVLCLSPDEVVGAVVAGVTVQQLENMSQWPGCEPHEDKLREFEHDS